MMNLKKKELIFSIIIMVIFLAIGLNISVLQQMMMKDKILI